MREKDEKGSRVRRRMIKRKGGGGGEGTGGWREMVVKKEAMVDEREIRGD